MIATTIATMCIYASYTSNRRLTSTTTDDRNGRSGEPSNDKGILQLVWATGVFVYVFLDIGMYRVCAGSYALCSGNWKARGPMTMSLTLFLSLPFLSW